MTEKVTDYSKMGMEKLVSLLKERDQYITQLENNISDLGKERDMLTNRLQQSLKAVPTPADTVPHLEHEEVIKELAVQIEKNDQLEKELADTKEKLMAAEFFQDYQKGEMNKLMGELATLESALEEAHEDLLHMTDDRDIYHDQCVELLDNDTKNSNEILELKKEIQHHRDLEDVLIKVCKEAQKQLDIES